MEKRPLNGLQLANMSFGFFGIQFGWSLQMANMSAIFEYLGAEAHQIPILWLAGPITGLIVQPVIGSMSDRTWNWIGRRRPYFLAGALASSFALVAMPNVSALWMAAILLWLLDTGANVSMEPFRAFVGDILPQRQHTQGYAVQSLFIGLGAVCASSLPWVLNHVSQLSPATVSHGTIPPTIKLAFYLGAAVFLGTVLWTIFTTQEYPPSADDIANKENGGGLGAIFTSIVAALRTMPPVMRQLAWVQILSWMGLFCVFLYFSPMVAHHVFGANSQASPAYTRGIAWAGICLAVCDGICCLFSFLLSPLVHRLGHAITYALCLLFGAGALVSLFWVNTPYQLILPMVGLGIARAGILSLPYAMLVGALPTQKVGIYMGLFNAFIVIPQIVASLGLGWVLRHWLDGNLVLILVMGGGLMLLGALSALRVQEPLGDAYVSALEQESV